MCNSNINVRIERGAGDTPVRGDASTHDVYMGHRSRPKDGISACLHLCRRSAARPNEPLMLLQNETNVFMHVLAPGSVTTSPERVHIFLAVLSSFSLSCSEIVPGALVSRAVSGQAAMLTAVS